MFDQPVAGELFDPADHYWFVAGDEGQVYSSKAGAYVPAKDAGLALWRADGRAPTRIVDAFELDAVLRGYGGGLGRAFTAAEALQALARIDAGKARAALGREDLSDRALIEGDGDTLRALALEIESKAHFARSAPLIAGATKPATTAERIKALEDAGATRVLAA